MARFVRQRLHDGAVLLASLAAMSCGFDLPTPPNLEPLNARYDHPTAIFGSPLAQDLIIAYTAEQARLSSIGGLRDVRQLVAEFDEGVTVSSQGDEKTVLVEGIPIRTDALVTLEGRCEASRDPALDDIVATAVVRDSRVIPVVWGDLADCAVRSELDASVTARLWGDVEVFIPTLTTEATPIYLIRYDLERVRVAAQDEPGWRGDIRYVGEIVELLLSTTAGDTAVLWGGPTPAVGVRAANGRWECFVEEQRCEALDSEDSSFSY